MPKSPRAGSTTKKSPVSGGNVAHDRLLFDALVAHMRAIDPKIRVGSMFGSPAVFVGQRMAFCVFKTAVGAKVPEADAARLIATGVATPFRPYGKPAMKEWVELRAKPESAPELTPILSLALRYAKESA